MEADAWADSTASIDALCTRTKVIGAGNHFEVLIPLSDIESEGQNYRIIRSSECNRQKKFHSTNGIEPHTTDIIQMRSRLRTL